MIRIKSDIRILHAMKLFAVLGALFQRRKPGGNPPVIARVFPVSEQQIGRDTPDPQHDQIPRTIRLHEASNAEGHSPFILSDFRR